MGTTVTPNLALIKPDTDESIKEALPTFAGWHAQNAANCDKIDSLFRDDTFTYSPGWTASSVNPTLGATGFVDAKFIRLFPSMIFGFFRIYTGGAGFAAGTGTYRINIPTGIEAAFTTFFDSIPVGKAILRDDDTIANGSVMSVNYNVLENFLHLRSPVGLWTPTVPITMAQQDRVSGYFIYPTSDV